MSIFQAWIKTWREQFATGMAPKPVAMGTGPGQNWLLAQSGDGGEKRKVQAGRRRHDDTAGSAPRERAEAPDRDRPSPAPPSSGGTRPPSSGGSWGGSPSSVPSGGGMRMSPLLMGVVLVVLLLCIVPIFLLQGGGGGDAVLPADQQPADQFDTNQPPLDLGQVQPTAVPALPTRVVPTRTPLPVVPAGGQDSGTTWTVMLYQDADDKILEQDIYVDLNEAERVGSSENVNIVAQIDRYRGGFQGDGDWTSAKRFYVTQDDDLQRVRSQQVADLGEVNMSDTQTLVDFVRWAVANYPADKYALILSDHGMGWPGGWSDPTVSGSEDRRIPLTSALGNQMYLMELDDALGQIRSETGIDKFELLGMDACLMGHLEVLSALEPHARYAVVSQETEPALGWAYTSFLSTLTANPGMNGGQLGQVIVDSYIADDQRIVDDQARTDFVGRGASARQLANRLGRDVTLTAIDLQALPDLMASVDSFAYSLQGLNQRTVAQARNYAQAFTSIFGSNVPASYIDLGNFAELLKREGGNATVSRAADTVMAALGRVVLAEKHGPNKPGATGVSVYFPNSQLYRSAVAGPQSYTAIARRFVESSLWDDFLAFHYTGRQFEPAANQVAVPQRGETIVAPGAGVIEVSPISLSSKTAAPGQPVVLSADISGDKVGYIKFFVGFYDRDANSINVADSDYLESSDTREVDGVYYPDWGEGDFTLEFEWEPVVFAINDGQKSHVALFNPETYGKTRDEATYSVDGIYTYADGGEQRYAKMYFANGEMQQVFGFTNPDGTGAPREITPQPGDTFTIVEKWLDLNASGQIEKTAAQEGDTLTFGTQPFRWKELDAAAGDYLVGFIVEDLDGNPTAAYARVAVE